MGNVRKIEANQDNFEGDEGLGKYERKIPDRFETEADDQFMNSIISKYISCISTLTYTDGSWVTLALEPTFKL